MRFASPNRLHRQVLAGIAEARFEQPLGEMEGDGARADVLQHRRRDLDALADDALHQHRAGADILGRQDEPGVVGELRRAAARRAVRRDSPRRAGKTISSVRALLDRLDARDGLRRVIGGDHRLGGEG